MPFDLDDYYDFDRDPGIDPEEEEKKKKNWLEDLVSVATGIATASPLRKPEGLEDVVLASPLRPPRFSKKAPEYKPTEEERTPKLSTAPEESLFQKIGGAVEEFVHPRRPGQMAPARIAEAQIISEARKHAIKDEDEEGKEIYRPMHKEEYMDKVAPEFSGARKLAQYPKDVAAGAVGVVEGFAGSAEWVTNGLIGGDLANQAKVWAQDLSGEQQTFGNQLAQGAGSMAMFFVPGIGVMHGATAVAKVAPRLAKWMGAGTMTAIEAMTEAGLVYREVMNKTRDQASAERAAFETFTLNVPLLTITNKLGIFGEQGKRLRRTLMSSAMEGTQEMGQELISTGAKDEEVKWGEVLTAGAIGAILGGGTGALSHGAMQQGKVSDDQRAAIDRALASLQVPDTGESSVLVKRIIEGGSLEDVKFALQPDNKHLWSSEERVHLERHLERMQATDAPSARLDKAVDDHLQGKVPASGMIDIFAQQFQNMEALLREDPQSVEARKIRYGDKQPELDLGTSSTPLFDMKDHPNPSEIVDSRASGEAVISPVNPITYEVGPEKGDGTIKTPAPFEEMVKEAARWKGAALNIDEALAGDNKARLAHSRITTKGDLDAYLMKKYGIDATTARDVSNELTDKNIPADRTAKPEDFANEPWAKTAGGEMDVSKVVTEEYRPYSQKNPGHGGNYTWKRVDRSQVGKTIKQGEEADFEDYTIDEDAASGQVEVTEFKPHKIRERQDLGIDINEKTKTAITDSFEIAPDLRGKGLGTKLWQKIEADARKLGAERFEIWHVMSDARDFWRKMGFKPIGNGSEDSRTWAKEKEDFLPKAKKTSVESTKKGTTVREDSADYEADKKADTFYSQMAQVLDKKLPNQGTPAQFRTMINAWAQKGEFKAEELKWSGVDEWLAGKKEKVTKQDVVDFIHENQIQIQEITKGETVNPIYRIVDWNQQVIESGFETRQEAEERRDALEIEQDAELYVESEQGEDELTGTLPPGDHSGETKYSNYQLPGGENYRELLLTLPERSTRTELDAEARKIAKRDGLDYDSLSEEDQRGYRRTAIMEYGSDHDAKVNYRSSHWSEPNVLLHVRMNDRVDADGKKVLFLEELQSDWHQEGRKKGYGPQGKFAVFSNESAVGEYQTREEAEKAAKEAGGNTYIQDLTKAGVPHAPFSKTWHELGMKRMLRYAAENGYDRIAWTTGEQQAERYDLSKQVDEISYIPNDKTLRAKRGGETVIELVAERGDLAEYLGKEAAKKLIDGIDAANPYAPSVLSGDGLKIGGEGMKGFYDKILPAFMNKYVKKWGSKVGETNVDTGPDGWRNDLEDKRIAWSEGRISTQEYEAFKNKLALRGNKTAAVHSVDITPQMREEITTKGQAYYEPKGKYATKALNLLERAVDFFTARLPGLPKRAKGSAYKDATGVRGEKTRHHTVGKMVDDLKALKHVRLRGAEVKTWNDVYEALRITRNKNVEVLQVLYIGEETGQILYNEACSSRLPGAVQLASTGILASSINATTIKLKRLAGEGVKVALAHNHPSGDVVASDADMNMTRTLAANLGHYHVPFDGHMILNHNYYGLINKEGSFEKRTISDVPAAHAKDPLLTIPVPHDKLGSELTRHQHIASIAKDIRRGDKYFTVLMRAKEKVRGIVNVEVSILEDPKKAHAYLKDLMVNHGATDAFAYKEEFTPAQIEAMKDLVKGNTLRDAVWGKVTKAESLHNMGFERDPQKQFGQDVEDYQGTWEDDYATFMEEAAPYGEESAAIIKRAKADGTYLKAPTGKPTKLNPKQWAQVRTKAFKKWFGDWEHDPKNASKVVDENGEPLVVYHGTVAPENFDEFSVGQPVYDESAGVQRMGSGADMTAYLGSHFTDDKKVAGAFSKGMYGEREHVKGEGGRIYPVFLSIKNPAKRDEQDMRDDMMTGSYNSAVIDETIERFAARMGSDVDGLFEKYDNDGDFAAEVNDEALSQESQEEDPTYELAQEMASDYRTNLQRDGVDGIRYENDIEGGMAWIAFEPGQIKSATANWGTFDANEGSILKDKDAPYGENLGEPKEDADISFDFGANVEKAIDQNPEDHISIDFKDHLEANVATLRGLVIQGEPGRSHTEADTGEVIYWASTYPEFMQGEGWSSKEVLSALSHSIKGEQLTDKQREIVQAAIRQSVDMFYDDLSRWRPNMTKAQYEQAEASIEKATDAFLGKYYTNQKALREEKEKANRAIKITKSKYQWEQEKAKAETKGYLKGAEGVRKVTSPIIEKLQNDLDSAVRTRDSYRDNMFRLMNDKTATAAEAKAQQETAKKEIEKLNKKITKLKDALDKARTAKPKQTKLSVKAMIRIATGQNMDDGIWMSRYKLLTEQIRREAMAARQAFAAGNKEATLKARANYKMLQAQQRAMREIRRDTNKMIKDFKKVLKDAAEMTPEHAKAIRALLQDFTLTNLSSEKRLQLETLRDALMNDPNADIADSVLDSLKRLDQTPIRALAYPDLKALHTAVMHYAALGKLGPMMIMSQKKVMRDMILKRTFAEMKSAKAVAKDMLDITITDAKNAKNELGKLKDRFSTHLIDTYETIIESIAGANSMAYRVLMREIKRGINERDGIMYELEEDYMAAQEAWQKKHPEISNLVKWLEETVEFGGIKMSRNQALSLYRGWYDPDFSRSIVEGGFGIWANPDRQAPNRIYNITHENYGNAVSKLSQTEKDFADIAIPSLQKSGDLLAAKFLEINGYEMPRVEGGVYWRKDVMSSERQQDEEQDLLKERFGRPHIFKGMTKARTKSDAAVWLKPYTLALRESHRRAADYVGLEEAMNNAAWLIYDKDFRREFDERYGRPVWREIEKGLKDISGQGTVKEDIDVVRWARWIRNAQTAFFLGWNYVTAFKQINGVLKYSAYVPPGYMARALTTYISAPFETKRVHRDNSIQYKRRREFGYNIESANVIRELNQQGRRPSIVIRGAALSLQPLQMMDITCVDIGMLAATYQALDAFKSGTITDPRMQEALDRKDVTNLTPAEKMKLAYEWADWITERSQAQFAPEFTSGWQRGTELEKMFSMFFGEMQANLAGMARAKRMADRGLPGAKAFFMKIMFFYVIMAALVDMFGNKGSAWSRGRAGDKWWAAVLKSMSGYVPVVRDVIDPLIDSAQGKGIRQIAGGNTPIGRLITELGKVSARGVGVIKARTPQQRKKEALGAADALITVASMGAGIPYPAIKRPYQVWNREEQLKKTRAAERRERSRY